MLVDDLNKTLPASNTSPNSSSDGNASSVSLSSSAPPITPSTHSSTSSPLNTAHDADSLDKILADLEAQLKAKQDGGSVTDENKVGAKTDAPKINSSPSISSSIFSPSTSPSVSQTHKQTELVVEEKHDLIPVKSDTASVMKTPSPIFSTPSSISPSLSVVGLTTSHTIPHSASSTPNLIVEHSFVPGSGVAAALKKVAPETVGTVNPAGLNPVNKDIAIPNATPPNMPGVANIKINENTVNKKPPTRFGQAIKKVGKIKLVLGSFLMFLVVGGLVGVSILVKQSQETRKYASSGWCKVEDNGVTAGYVPCDTPGETLQGTYKQVMNIRDNAPAVDPGLPAEQLQAVQQQVGNANTTVNDEGKREITGGTHGGQENVNDCSGNSCNTGNEGNGAAVAGGGTPSGGAPSGETTAPSTGTSTTGNGTTADNACTAQDSCGGPNQGYCTCGSDGKPDPKGKPTCQGGYEVLGGDCVPIGTKESVSGKPGDSGTHCQSDGECGNGLVCSSHVCSKSAQTPTTSTNTGTLTGDIPVPGTDGKLVIRNGKIIVADFVAGQTIGNMCDSGKRTCNSYDDWIKGYYDAKKAENFGVKSLDGKPVYTDILTDLDTKTPNTQVGTIKYDDFKKEWYIDGIATINLDSSLSDDAKKAKSNTGGISVSSLATSYTVNPDGTLKYAGQTLTGATIGVPQAWKDLAKSGCNQPSNIDLSTGTIKPNSTNSGGKDLFCHGSNGTDFCVPNGWSDTDGTTCDQYFSRYGIAIRYQAFGTDRAPDGSKLTAAYIAQFCGTAEDTTTVNSSLGSYKVITCNGSPAYTQCVDHLNGTFTCYLRDKDGIAGSAIPTSAGFKLTNNGDCLEPSGKDAGTQFNAYSCDPNTSGGCQDNGQSYSGKMCLSSVIASLGVSCGKTIQIDADDTQGNHYSINQWLPACGAPKIDTPPIIVNRPPTTQTLCTNCGGGGPEPTPSPAPPGSPVCVGISASIPSPRLGQAPTFTCSSAAEATRYEFRSKIDAGAYATLAPSAANSNVSSPLTVNASGVYTIQCRPCNANGCANWENL